jgi:hypothetical protein
MKSSSIARRALGCCAIVAAVGVAAPARADDLGRLFYTPQQRAELDKRRLSNEPPPEETVREVLVTVNGYVSRSSGKTTTWINGVPQYDSVRSSDPSRVPVESGDTRKPVKVGATLDTNRGDVRDVIGDGQIKIQRPSAKQ